METDKKTIGLTESNKVFIQDLIDKGWFEDKLDAARLAMAIAIREGIEPLVSIDGDSPETVWNVGSFDPDGELRNVIPILFPSVDAPYRLVEYFLNRGLQLISEMIKDPSFELHQLLE